MYEGYYPKAAGEPAQVNKKGRQVQTHFTTSRTYQMGKYSPVQALTLVVDRLWKLHKNVGKDTCVRKPL